MNRHRMEACSPPLVTKFVKDSSAWGFCADCADHIDKDRATLRYWDEELPLQSNAALAAAYAWLGLFGSWPEAIAFRSDPPPRDGAPCTQCGRRAYPDDQVALIKADLFHELKAGGGLEVRFAPSESIGGVPVFCHFCLKRAVRIAG